MSYDVSLMVDAGGAEPVEIFWINHTSNTGDIWRALDCDLADWEGELASTHIEALTAAVEELNKNPQAYRKYEPDNGWGTVESTRNFLDQIRQACVQAPKASFHISR